MQLFYTALAVFLLVTMLAALVRAIRGPTPADRLMTAQLFGTTGVAILLLLGVATNQPALRDVALVFALLAVVVVLCFVQTASEGESSDKDIDS